MNNLTEKDVENINTELSLTRAQRIRASMFPETLEEGIPIPSVPFDPANPPALQRLAEPSQMLRIAIRNLINYQDDATVTTFAIPELNLLLREQDEKVLFQTTLTVHKLTKKEASRNALAANSELVSNLIATLNNSEDLATLRDTTGALFQLSKDHQGLLAIFKSHGIPVLLKMMDLPDMKILVYAVSTLYNLLRFQEGAKDEVLYYNGLPQFMKFLTIDKLKFLAVIIHCLCILAHENEETKFMMFEANAHYPLLAILNGRFDYEKLLWVTSRLLVILSVPESAKIEIVRAGALQMILQQFELNISDRVVMNCLWLLLNISQASSRFENRNLIDFLQKYLQSQNGDSSFCAAGVLSNLTCNNPANKMFLSERNGVSDVLEALKRGNEHEGLVLAAVATLRHITGMNQYAAKAQDEVRACDGIRVVVDLLTSSVNTILTGELIGLLRHLSLFRGNHEVLIQNGVISHLRRSIQIFEQENQLYGNYDKLLKVAYATIYELNNNELDEDEANFIRPLSYVEGYGYSPVLKQGGDQFSINVEDEEGEEDSNLLPPPPPASEAQMAWMDTNL